MVSCWCGISLLVFNFTSDSFAVLTREMHVELNTQGDIPYLCAPIYRRIILTTCICCTQYTRSKENCVVPENIHTSHERILLVWASLSTILEFLVELPLKSCTFESLSPWNSRVKLNVLYAFLWNTTYISYYSKLRLGTSFLDRIPLYGGVLITITDTFIFLFLDKYGKLQSPCSFNLIQCECRNTGRKKVFLMIYFFVYKNKDKHKKLIEGVI